MKKVKKYKGWTLCEVTKRDTNYPSYILGEILCFLPGERPCLQYEEWQAGTMQEAIMFIDSYKGGHK